MLGDGRERYDGEIAGESCRSANQEPRMVSVEFNVSGRGQHLVVEKDDGGLNPRATITVEALVYLRDDGEDPTVLSMPAKERWERPFVAWRLGFFARERRPEFQVTIEGDEEPTTVRADQPVPRYQMVHIAGTYDGRAVRLFVDGHLAAEVEKTGSLLASRQKTTMGARSSTDMGGEFTGRQYEARVWTIARTAAEIETWKDKTLQFPAPDGLAACWGAEPSIGAEKAKSLIEKGLKPVEITLASFIFAYATAYARHSPDMLTGAAKERFHHSVHSTILIRTADGFLVLYEPTPPGYLVSLGADSESIGKGGFIFFDWSKQGIAETIQGLTGNRIKVGYCETNASTAKVILPEDNKEAVDWMVHERLKQAGVQPPAVHIIDKMPGVKEGEHAENGRIRIVSPLVRLESGEITRAFTWLFADIWYGELSLELARKGLADLLAVNDIAGILLLSAIVLERTAEAAKVSVTSPLLPLEKVIADFQALIERDDVDEVRDVLPFLAKPEHWVILRPTCEAVWPEKMLGNKWRVDFIARDGDKSYIAIEVESPKKRLYKSGPVVEPYQEWMHAEQQVRDYCNFIDMNRDYVEREEGLPGIFRPRGIVIIGRRGELSQEGRKKLAERNADSGRYQTITFDDLLDQARNVVARLRAVIAPHG